MKRSIILIFLLSLIFGQNVIATDRRIGNDTMTVNLLNRRGFAIRFTDPKQSIADATKALAMAKVQKYKSGIEEAHRIIGIGYYYLNQPARAMTEFKEALKCAIQNNDLKAQAKVYNNIGNLYLGDDYDKALSFYEKELSIFLMLKDSVKSRDTRLAIMYIDTP